MTALTRPRLRLPRPRPAALSSLATRAHAATALGGTAVLVLAGASAAAAFGPTPETTHLTAHFTRVVGLYPGSSVRVLGVKVGTIDSVVPEGTTVAVRMTVKGVRVAADSDAVIVPPALVSDRYVQVRATQQAADAMPDNGQIPVERTEVPVEKDQIVASLDGLDRALGPDGANKDGALSRLLHVGAQNLAGNGDQINQTLRDLASLVGTLDDNKDGLTGTVSQLDTFTNILLKNDAQIRKLYPDLAQVSQQLADDRGALAQAFANLAVATKDLSSFAQTNRAPLKQALSSLVDVTNVLVQDKKALEETLDTAPLGLSNLAGAFNAQTQTLDTRGNQVTSDPNAGIPLVLCTALTNAQVPTSLSDPLCSAFKTLGSQNPPALPGGTAAALQKQGVLGAAKTGSGR